MIFTKRKTIGVFISKMFKVFDDAFFRALETESRRLDYDFVVFTTAGYYLSSSDYDIQEKNILRFAPSDWLDGIIAVPGSYEKGDFRTRIYEMLQQEVHCPVVLVREDSDTRCCATTDNRDAIRPLVRHLIEDHGLKRICMQYGHEDHLEALARLEGFRLEMQAHGLDVPDSAVCPGNMWTSCAETAWNAFFSDPENRPEAVVCGNDYMAMGLIRLLKEKGLRVPEDVIVTGFDNVQDWCLDVPGLTTVQPDYSGMVAAAMDLLDRRIRAKETPLAPERIGLPGQLILGESCGCGRRGIDFFRRISEKAMALLEAENNQDAAMNNMSIDMSVCDNLTELHQVLVSDRTGNPIVRDHYLCLFGTPDRLLTDESGDQAVLTHAFRDHRDCGMPMITFDRKKLLPLMAERLDEPQVFYVKLLHQKGHNFGYSIFHYDPGEAPSRCFVQTNVLLCIALENIRRHNELMALYEERRLSSITDMLTGLLNRRGLMEMVEPLWPSLTSHYIAFICLDIDRLKRINDTYGHAAGDYAIRLVGRAVQLVLPPGAAGARTGGDEFVIFLPDSDRLAAERLIREFEKALADLNRQEARSFTVTASAGFAVQRVYPGLSIEQCILTSDRKLYQAKEAKHRAEAGK